VGDAATPRRILVIEDEESLRHVLSKGLRRAGYACETAATGREGVERFGQGGFDAVLTDVRLPDLSGLDVLALLSEIAPGVPVIVMTGYGTVDTAIDAMRRGATDFLQKPFPLDAVTALLAKTLDGRPAADADKALRVQVERRFAPERFGAVEAALPALRPPEGPPAAPPAAPPGGAPESLKDAQRRFEVQYVEDLLARTGGNVAAAARLAGISRPNFHKKLKTLGVDPARFKRAARRGRADGS
jgi:DNA-binding NtrC family response regulator